MHQSNIAGINEKGAETNKFSTPNISSDLTWINVLKGIAIIGVFFENWDNYMKFTPDPNWLYLLGRTFTIATGPFVQVFFILSGFGLTLGYYKERPIDWKKWAWRRLTKIVLPYTIFVLFTFILGAIGKQLYPSAIKVEFSWLSLLTHLTFTRNFYPPSWPWNPPLWYMPPLIGLYISFPLLIKILEKHGAVKLLIGSLLVTYITLILASLFGAAGNHSMDLFTFWTFQFALGMVMAHTRKNNPELLSRLLSVKAFLIGLGLVLISWVLRTYVPLGHVFNDSVTSIGIFLVLLNLMWTLRAKLPITASIFSALGRDSFLMYLMHYPIMQFLIGPPLRTPTNPLLVIAMGALFIGVIFLLSHLISGPMNKLTAWANAQYQA